MFRFFCAPLASLPFPSEPYPGPYRGVEGGSGGLEKSGAHGTKEYCKGFEGATLLIHLHGKGPG